MAHGVSCPLLLRTNTRNRGGRFEGGASFGGNVAAVPYELVRVLFSLSEGP